MSCSKIGFTIESGCTGFLIWLIITKTWNLVILLNHQIFSKGFSRISSVLKTTVANTALYCYDCFAEIKPTLFLPGAKAQCRSVTQWIDEKVLEMMTSTSAPLLGACSGSPTEITTCSAAVSLNSPCITSSPT